MQRQDLAIHCEVNVRDARTRSVHYDLVALSTIGRSDAVREDRQA